MPTTIQPRGTALPEGTAVELAIRDMTPRAHTLGVINCIVIHGGSEADLMIIPDEENLEDAADLLASNDMTLEETREGAVYMLRNCQWEEITAN